MKYNYGTSGFRFKIEIILSISQAIGTALGIISEEKNKYLGIMITASHNDYTYNGVKIIDYNGQLLSKYYEDQFVRLVNSNSDYSKKKRNCKILIGYDTRPSCQQIKELIISGCQLIDFSPTIIDLGLMSTPQMHFMTYQKNFDIRDNYFDYYNFHNLPIFNIYVDCSNGVGTHILNKINVLINNNKFKIKMINTDIDNHQLLNYECGSDYVCSKMKLPQNSLSIVNGNLMASLDGDADRIVFYYLSKQNLNLLDGDKIISLICLYLHKIGINNKLFSIGIVHTAYSNRKFIKFIKDLGFNTYCVPTGVKYLHSKAKQFNIGIYFESNGHGTVLFNINNIHEYPDLKKLSTIFNQFIGDAISDLFAIMYILDILKISFEEWYNLYKPNLSTNGKIKIKNKNLFQCNHHESELIQPELVKNKINNLISLFDDSYIFIRPSGTEDVIRYYIESPNQKDLNSITIEIEKMLNLYV